MIRLAFALAFGVALFAPGGGTSAQDGEQTARLFWDALRCLTATSGDEKDTIELALQETLLDTWPTPRMMVADLQRSGQSGHLMNAASSDGDTRLCGKVPRFANVLVNRLLNVEIRSDQDQAAGAVLASLLLNEQVITASIVDMIMKLEADRMPEDWNTAFERETQREILDELLQDLPWGLSRQ